MKTIAFEGVTHQFPDDFSDSEISDALGGHQKKSLGSYFTERLPQLAKDTVTGLLDSGKQAVMAPGQAYNAGVAGNTPTVSDMVAPAANMALWAAPGLGKIHAGVPVKPPISRAAVEGDLNTTREAGLSAVNTQDMDAAKAAAQRARETSDVLNTHNTLSDAKAAAETKGGTTKKYQSQISRLLGDNDFMQTLSPELREQLLATQKGSLTQRGVRTVGDLLTGTFSPGRAGLAYLGLHGDILSAIAGDAARFGARKIFQSLDDRMTRQAMDELLQMSLNEAPAARGPMAAPRVPGQIGSTPPLRDPNTMNMPGSADVQGAGFSMSPPTPTPSAPFPRGPIGQQAMQASPPLPLPAPQQMLLQDMNAGARATRQLPWGPETPPSIPLGKNPQAVSYWEHNGKGVPQIRDASGRITPASETVDNIRRPALRDAMGRFVRNGALKRGKTSRPPQEESQE